LLDDGFEIQSASAMRPRSPSSPAVVMRAAVLFVKNGSGFIDRARARPCAATVAVTSSSSTRTPAFARCAANWDPIVPAPITAAEWIASLIGAVVPSRR